MRFPDSFLDEIRQRLPASAVVGRRVKLKKQGREFAGLSPFNAEKSPLFFVNDTKGKWFDFSASRRAARSAAPTPPRIPLARSDRGPASGPRATRRCESGLLR